MRGAGGVMGGGLGGIGLGEFGESKIQHLDQAVIGHHDVAGLQIAMDDSGSVGLGESVGDLRAKGDDFGIGETALANEVVQGVATHTLHGNVGNAVVRVGLRRS